MAYISTRLRRKWLLEALHRSSSLAFYATESSNVAQENVSLPTVDDNKACNVLSGKTSAHAEDILRQKIGLTQKIAHIRQGRLEWESLCPSKAGTISPESASGLLSSLQGRLHRAYKYVRGHTIDQFGALFLPAGYPHTVKENYLRYSFMAACTNFMISVNMTVAAAFLLYAVGLGAGAIPVAGALSWVLKDGAGQAGTLILGRIVSYDFDLNTRFWNLMSNVTVQLACCVEISAVFYPEYFLLMASVANILKGVSHIAGSSTRAAFNISFAQGENIADITAKATSQYICTSLLGTCVGIFVSGTVGQNASLALMCAACISLVTTAVTYATLRAVPLANLNSTRLQLLIDYFVRTRMLGFSAAAKLEPLPRPNQLCIVDPVVQWPAADTFHPPILVNTPLSEILHNNLERGDQKLLKLLAVHRRSSAMHLLLRDGRQRSSRLHVILHRDATPHDAIMAMLHAFLFRREVKRHLLETLDFPEEAFMLRKTLEDAQANREDLLEGLRQSNWNMERVCIEGHACRATW